MFLPVLALSGGRWRLPLSDNAALAICRGVLSSDELSGVETFAAALRDDPFLALWVSCRCWLSEGHEPRTADELARWLWRRWPDEWAAWSEASEEPDGAARGRFANWVKTSSRVSALAWRLAAVHCGAGAHPQISRGALAPGRREPDASASRLMRLSSKNSNDASASAELLGALSPARVWLQSSEICVRRPDSPHALPLPPALRELFGEGAKPPAPQSAPWSVRKAWRILRDKAEIPAGVGLHSGELKRLGRVAKAAWLAPKPGAELAPAIVGRLRRVRVLEADWAEALEQEKLEAIAEFAAGAGHEINNPLGVILGRAQLLLRDEESPQRRRDLEKIAAQARRVYEMLAGMMFFARPPAPRPERMELAETISNLVAAWREEAAAREIELQLQADSPVHVRADRSQIEMAVRSLVDNALDALSAGDKIRIHVEGPPPGRENPMARIVVADTGPGIPPDVRRHLFDPYFSGRDAGRGLGVGLSKVWRIVTGHGGQVRVDCGHPRGATFTLLLPLAGPAEDSLDVDLSRAA